MADVKLQVGDSVTWAAAGTQRAGRGVVYDFVSRDVVEIIDSDTGRYARHLNIDLTRQTPTFEVVRRVELVWTVEAETAAEAASVIYSQGPHDSHDLEQSLLVTDQRYDADTGHKVTRVRYRDVITPQ